MLTPELTFRIDPKQSRFCTRLPIARIAITDPSVVEVNEYGPAEIEVIGVKSGETTMTIWFNQPGAQQVLRYLVPLAPSEPNICGPN